ncbi:MAG: TetR/AcrR family transcriptional regulator C-terminal domain-containing protein [Archangium sp.]
MYQYSSFMDPYQRIANELRRRIESGQLKPGAKVPSTRALAKKWKVAPVTAAHALKALAHDGLIEARPRSGNVVVGAAQELSRARIVNAAVRIADEQGLNALSIRAVAAAVNAPAMSLYRHVGNKDQLLALMTDEVLGERPKEPKLKTWREMLEWGARIEWKAMKKHPWLARVVHISRPSAMPNAAWMANWVMQALDGTSLSEPQKLQVHVTLHAFVQGVAVNVEAEAQAIGDTGMTEDDHMNSEQVKFEKLAASGKFPHFAKMLRGIPNEFQLSFDDVFELGLKSLLDGFSPRLAAKLQTRAK